MFPKLEIDLISRRSSASPAIGYAKLHDKEQQEIIQKAIN
jgi:2-oxoglutarate dehydrogenase complex dehydrogenase (E1) component-like enzyme